MSKNGYNQTSSEQTLQKATKQVSGSRFDILKEGKEPEGPTGEGIKVVNQKPLKEWRRREGKTPADVTAGVPAGANKAKAPFQTKEGSNPPLGDVAPTMLFAAQREEKKSTAKKKSGNMDKRGSSGQSRNKLSAEVVTSASAEAHPVVKKSLTNRKRSMGSRPITVSPLLNRRSSSRVHQVVFDEKFPRGPLNFEPDISVKAQKLTEPTSQADVPLLGSEEHPPTIMDTQPQLVEHRGDPPDPSQPPTIPAGALEVLEPPENWYETQVDSLGEHDDESDAMSQRPTNDSHV